MSSDIIDLCGSESEEYERQPKRQRHNYDDDDSEVIVVEEETGNGDDQQDQPEESQQLGDDEELRIVGHTGQVGITLNYFGITYLLLSSAQPVKNLTS